MPVVRMARMAGVVTEKALMQIMANIHGERMECIVGVLPGGDAAFDLMQMR